MLSEPLNTVTPACRRAATGGKAWLPGALVMIATPADASAVLRQGVAMPSAFVRVAISSTWKQAERAAVMQADVDAGAVLPRAAALAYSAFAEVSAAPQCAIVLSRRYEPPWLTRAPSHPNNAPPARVDHGRGRCCDPVRQAGLS